MARTTSTTREPLAGEALESYLRRPFGGDGHSQAAGYVTPLEVLRELTPGSYDRERGQLSWYRPMDVGGTSRSPHSRVLESLWRYGLALRCRRWSIGNSIAASVSRRADDQTIPGVRGSWRYAISPAGVAALELPRNW